MAGLAAVLFCGAAQMQNLLNADRQQLGFTLLPPLQNAPPILAFTTVALGGFRGLISNALWIRASELQEQERYFEMVQLADWITKLEPHFATVWTMQAWNMAYNISVKCKDFDERWRWVQRGIQLLYQGLKYNPGEVDIYKELSWFFRHKIGQNLDDAHLLYKLRWAQQMQDILGGHPDFPALINPRTPEERERARILTNDYHMDPAFIQELDKRYGPLDWRLPDAHAIYWAEMGVRNGTQQDKDLIRRFAYAIMQQACKRGGALPPWVKKVTPDNFILWPNLDLVPTVNAAYERTKVDDPDKKWLILTAQKNFLKDAVVLLYEYNRTRDANHWFNYLKTNFTNALTSAEASLSAEDYAKGEIQRDIGETDPNKATMLILGLISQEYLSLIADQDDDAANFKNLAQGVWQYYQSKLPSGQNGERIALEPFDKLARFQLEQMPVSPQALAILRAKLGASPPASPPATNSAPPPGPRT
jgi:hypothetical protein